MSMARANAERSAEMKDRRRHARQPVRSLVYLKLGLDNGGVVLNVSAGGLVVRAANMLTGEDLSRVQFQVPRTRNHLEISGQIVWLSESKKEAGVRFLEMTDDARLQLTQWIASEASAAELQRWREIFSAAVRSSSTTTTPTAAELAAPITKPAKPSPVAASDVRASQPQASVTHPLAGVTTSPPAKDALAKQKWQRVLSLANQRRSPIPAASKSASATPEPAPPSSPTIPTRQQNPAPISPALPEEGIAAASQIPQQASPASELIAQLPEPEGLAPDVEPQNQESATVSPPVPTISAEETVSRPEQPEPKMFSLRTERNQIRAGWILAGLCGVLAVLFLSFRKTTPTPNVTYVPPVAAATTEEVGANSPEMLLPSDTPSGVRRENGIHLIVTGPAVRPRRSKTKFPVATLTPPSSPHRTRADDNLENETASVPVTPSTDLSNAPSSIAALAPSVPLPAPPEPKPQRPPQAKLLEPAYLLYRVEPAYPHDAAAQHIEGSVKMRAFIGKDGRVQKIELVSGPPSLVEAAMNAARAWRYIPAILNGQPVENEEEISIDFRLPR
jgi:TonB family protein